MRRPAQASSLKPGAGDQRTPVRVTFDSAYYVKLGRGGKWEESSIREGKVRIGWLQVPVDEINTKKWSAVERRIRQGTSPKGATADLNALRKFCESTSSDLWITFHVSRLWWCRLVDGPVEKDDISKYRRTKAGWSDRDADRRRLLTSEIPGRLSKIQGFRGTVCDVKDADALERLLNSDASPSYLALRGARHALEEHVTAAVAQLHWKDFEVLVDLIFRQAGWKRTSVVGETMKYADIELQEPITGDRYQVQVKSAATLSDLRSYAERFSGEAFRKLYFVVHSPDTTLENADVSTWPGVELVLPRRIAAMVIDAGLTDWLMQRVR